MLRPDGLPASMPGLRCKFTETLDAAKRLLGMSRRLQERGRLFSVEKPRILPLTALY